MSASQPHPHARRTLFLLWAVFAVAQLDRHILSLSLEAISVEFGLSDWQLGLLSGFAFAAVFVLVGFPVAMLCARFSRRNIVAGSVAIWSGFTIAAAATQSFASLLVTRVGVGAGEAGSVVPAHSLISDLYPEEKHTSSLSTFATGANFGVLLAAIIGGVIGQIYGWRVAMVIAGIPGLVLAPLLIRFGAEPKTQSVAPERNTARNAWLAIVQDPANRFAFGAFISMGVVTFALTAWFPILLMRMHGLNLAQSGLSVVILGGFVGGLGTYFCGKWIDWLGRTQARLRIIGVIVTVATTTLFGIGFAVSAHFWLGFSLLVVSGFSGFAFWGATFAFVYGRVDAPLRPMVTAFMLLGFNVVGLSIGPTLVGALSTGVFASFGEMSIGYSLAVSKAFGLLAVWLYWRAAQAMR